MASSRLGVCTLGVLLHMGAVGVGPALAREAQRKEPPPRATVDTDAGGRLTPELAAYDVRFYDVDLAIDPDARTVTGTVTVTARMTAPAPRIRLDLDDRLTVSAAERLDVSGKAVPTSFAHEGKVLWVDLDPVPATGETLRLAVRYAGAPREAPRPPWEGGFTWSHTEDGRPWIGVSCQIDGQDLWWPGKDHPSDEPDEGARLRYTVPAGLEVAANGRLEGVVDNGDGTRTWTWRVSSPINTYGVTFNAAPFRKLQAVHDSVAGTSFPVTYWVLPEHLEKGQALFPEMLHHLRFLEKTLGPYPFRAEKLGFVEAPYLGMEHQTAITYGDAFDRVRFGFHWIAFHELAHEWWGNLVSASDWRDFWLQEGFDGYTEALWVEAHVGPRAGREYVTRYFRAAIVNERPVAPRESRSLREVYYARPPEYTSVDIDAYAKGALTLHTLRYVMGDESFFALLRRWAYPDSAHREATDGSQTRIVSTDDFVALASEVAGRDLGWLFEVYLRQPVLPHLESRVENGRLHLEWRVPGGRPFPMPVEVGGPSGRTRVGMETGAGSIPWPGGADPDLDPDGWILHDAKVDPDRFGTLGAGSVPIPYRQQED